MGNRSKDENAAASNNRDQESNSRDQDTRDASLARIIAEAVAQQTKSIVEAVSRQKSEETQALTDVFQRQMEETRAQYEELLKASCAQKLSSTLKVSSGTDGFRVMDAFDWTNDKNIYQRWQLWSHKARLALDAMEGDNEKTKISYLHHWLDGKGIDKIKGWTNSKILIPQEEYDALEERDRKGRYSSDKIESYFSLVENILTPRSNPLLAVEELHLTKQGSMTSQEFHSQILEIVKRCRFPNQAAEDRAVRDAIFIGMNSQRTKDKAINFMNEEDGKEVTVEFLLNHLAIEDGNSQHRFLSQLDSSTSVNMIAYDRRQNKGKGNRSKNSNGREREQNKSRGHSSPSTVQTSRKPPGMEGKCMRCGRPEHEQGEKCAARHAKCKDCHKIGHFYKVCQSSKRTARANLAQVTPQEQDSTYIDECGYTQPSPPAINMLKVVNSKGATNGTETLIFPVDVNPQGTYKHHLEVSIDTGADVNCMNEKTFKKLFPEVDLSVCPHSIQNFGNSTADVYILGQFRVYLKFRGRKYLNTFIVTNANDCPNILSHGAIFRMGILVPNYPRENMVRVEDTVEDMGTGTCNVLQIRFRQQFEPRQHRPNTTFTTGTTHRKVLENTRSINTDAVNIGSKSTFEHTSPTQIPFRTMRPPKTSSFRTITTPELNTAYSTRRPHSHSEIQACCMHTHLQQSKTYRMEEPPALKEVRHPHRDRTSVSRSPSTEQEVLSQFSGFPKEIEHFTRDPYTNHLRSCTQSTDYAFKGQEVHTCINCEHSHGHMVVHVDQNTPEKHFLQRKEKSTCTYMGDTPALQGNKTNILKMDTNTCANMDTNHTAHRPLKDARKEAHLLSGPSELRPFKDARKEAHLLSRPSDLRPFKAMAHQHTRKEAHLLSGPSELQPTEHPETQKLDSAHVQQTRQEYSQLTETEKAKFQNPFIYNDDRNFVRHNSVNKISPNLVFMTTQNTSLSNSVSCRKKGRKRGRRRTAEITEGPAPAPAAEGPACTCTCSHTGETLQNS